MTTATENPAQANVQYYVWSFPGSPVKVQLDLKVVERLQKRFERGEGTDEQGLLWGAILGNTTQISDLQSLPQADVPSVKKALAGESKAPREHAPVGYYRTVQQGELRLTNADLAVAEALFRDPQNVFLLIQPTQTGPANATFFFWENGKLCGDFPFLEFPVDATLLAAAEKRRRELAKRRRELANENTAAKAPRTDQPIGASRPRKASLIPGILLGAAAICLLSGAILFQRYPDTFFRLHIPKKAPQTANPSPAPVTPTGSLPSIGLQAERQHGDVKLTWNHESSAILSATSGLLSIQDGDIQREIHLDSTLVRGGSLIYSPISDQIQMQFKVQGPKEAPTETVIIVLPKSGSPQVQLNSRSPEAARRFLDPF